MNPDPQDASTAARLDAAGREFRREAARIRIPPDRLSALKAAYRENQRAAAPLEVRPAEWRPPEPSLWEQWARWWQEMRGQILAMAGAAAVVGFLFGHFGSGRVTLEGVQFGPSGQRGGPGEAADRTSPRTAELAREPWELQMQLDQGSLAIAFKNGARASGVIQTLPAGADELRIRVRATGRTREGTPLEIDGGEIAFRFSTNGIPVRREGTLLLRVGGEPAVEQHYGGLGK